jgi:hypothetical protein
MKGGGETTAESESNPAEPDAGASEADDRSGEAERARAEDSAGNGSRVDFERVAGLWPAILDQVRESGSELLSAVFAAARPLTVDAERAVLEVGFPPSAAFNKRKAEAEGNRERLAEAVRTIVGESLRPVYVLLDGEDGETGNGAEPAMSEEELIERIKSEFDAEEFEPEEGSA